MRRRVISNELGWRAEVLEHPRLVGPWSPAMEALVRWYLSERRPCTVIVEPVGAGA